MPLHVSPCGVGMFFSPFSDNHCLTSPKIRTLLEFSTVRPKRKSAPFRVGYLRNCGPIRPVTGRRSLFPFSHTLCSIPLPYGWATTDVGGIGLTQLPVKKNVARFGWSLYPGEHYGCRRPRLRWDDPAHTPFWLWPVSLFGHVGFTRFSDDSSLPFNLTGLP
jgi:hypothetical protein